MTRHVLGYALLAVGAILGVTMITCTTISYGLSTWSNVRDATGTPRTTKLGYPFGMRDAF